MKLILAILMFSSAARAGMNVNSTPSGLTLVPDNCATLTWLNTQFAAQTAAIKSAMTCPTVQVSCPAPNLSAITASLASTATTAQLTAAVATLQAAIAAIPATGTTPAPTPTPAPVAACPTTKLSTVTVGAGQTFTKPSQAIGCMAPGFTMTILAGSYADTFDIPVGMDGWTIAGAGAGKTFINGQGGCPASNNNSGGSCTTRLAWGKGVIHAQSPGTVQDLTLENGGPNANTNGDGQAGLYGENFTSPGTLTARRVYFLFNEDGVFVPVSTSAGPGQNVNLVIDSCDFVNNGQGGNGYAHDMYASGPSTTVLNSNFYGNPFGNNIKSRSPTISVTGGWNQSNAGRWIDSPSGGTVTVSGGTYSQVPNDPQGNVIGWGEEGVTNPMGPFTITGSTFYFDRYASQIMIPTGSTIAVSGGTQNWTNAQASISVLNGGTLAGLSTSPGSTFVATPSAPSPVSGSAFITTVQ